MRFKPVLMFAFTAMLGLATAQARAVEPEWESTTTIREVAEQLVTGQSPPSARVLAAQLDPRLRLPRCPESLVASVPNPAAQGNWNVAVRCTSSPPGTSLWSIFVPVRVSDLRPVVVLLRALAPGQVVTSDAVALMPRDITTLTFGYLSDPSQAVGQRLRRPLVSGATLSPDALAAPTIIRRGMLVTLVGRIGGLEVRAQGKAMADGGHGDRIAVENSASHRMVEGVIADDNLVDVGL